MSNGRLASGIADIPKYRKMGIKIGMGVDGEGSADLPDPFENMRMAIVLACNAMNIAKVYVGGDLLVDTYKLQKNDMKKVSQEVLKRVARL